MTTILVPEDHENFQDIALLMRSIDAVDIPETEFDSADFASAKWLAMSPGWHASYPEPASGRFGYLEATYGGSHKCVECGAGLKQSSSFVMKSTPKWVRRSICQLYWVRDEFFVTDSLAGFLGDAYGIETAKVINRRGEILNDVHQIVVRDEVAINPANLEFSVCATCGTKRFSNQLAGMFPEVLTDCSAPIAKTEAYFGTGAAAWKRIVISKRLHASLVERGVKGADFHPARSS